MWYVMFNTFGKGEIAMLKKVKNQENVLMIFFVVVLVCVGLYAVFERSFLDIIYFGIMFVFFLEFLKIKKYGK